MSLEYFGYLRLYQQGESFFLARGSFGPEIFVSEFFWRQSPGFLALPSIQVEGLLAHIVTVLVIVRR